MSFKKMGKCKDADCPNPDKEQLLSSGRCRVCCERRFRGYGQKKGETCKKKAKAYKPTGEMGIFLIIWNTQPRVSFLDGTPLGNVLKPIFFSHILPKGSYPRYRLRIENIILLTEQQHRDWHSMAESDLLKQDARWQKVFDMRDKLRLQYNEESKIPTFKQE